METYLIEVPHDATEAACAKAIKIFLESGSHFLVNADWGCEDDEHKAWMLVDVDGREQAMHIVPPGLRANAKITRLRKFTREDINEYLETGHIVP
jgi:hypothetical protein